MSDVEMETETKAAEAAAGPSSKPAKVRVSATPLVCCLVIVRLSIYDSVVHRMPVQGPRSTDLGTVCVSGITCTGGLLANEQRVSLLGMPSNTDLGTAPSRHQHSRIAFMQLICSGPLAWVLAALNRV
jgi:hypothetical protein